MATAAVIFTAAVVVRSDYLGLQLGGLPQWCPLSHALQ